MKLTYTFAPLAMTAALGSTAVAAELRINVEIPRLSVAEYHKPYVAMWVERADQSFAANLAVWYDVKKQNNGGTEWLKDMRQWWRKSGRELQMPVDGVSGATRAPGQHELKFAANAAPLSSLQPGQYQLVIEAAREVGGRELLRIPFEWPAKKAEEFKAQGQHELGAATLALKP